ncbi:hypothetical protein PQG02_09420 [Nostoc sp. UHCC 0926]|uniref:hypothetical protein n=1 Tax=unclassified Nostoc TaxID=2593658 RepID=UPI00235F18A5|nr:hypothetical protein [Nostoc sp. UHCC 0926]WDD34518.1 hypothetical protein PQG02_09420 [Nostoc sp. UHCC 0926]
MSLESSLKLSRKGEKELEQVLEELVEKLADVKREKDTLTNGLERRQEYIQELERVNQLLRSGASFAPHYEVTRVRTLAKLKMGRQSSAGKAIDAFVKELTLLSIGSL